MDGQGKAWTLLMGIRQGLDPVPVCSTYCQRAIELIVITIVIIIIHNNSNNCNLYKKQSGILRLAKRDASCKKPGLRGSGQKLFSPSRIQLSNHGHPWTQGSLQLERDRAAQQGRAGRAAGWRGTRENADTLCETANTI